jgi:glycine betaine/proline transport system substrate-binding protein
VEDGGLLGPVGKISWYIPTYLLTKYPTLNTWEAYKDPTLSALFATPDTGTKGRFLAGDPSWTQYDADIIANNMLNLQVVVANTEQAELAELDRAYTSRGFILMYLWTPHSALAKYALTPVKLPDHTDACYSTANLANHGVFCDYPTDNLYKLFWPGFKEANPKAYAFLKNFSYTNKDQITLLGMVDNDNVTITNAARSWIQANTATWQAWIPK